MRRDKIEDMERLAALAQVASAHGCRGPHPGGGPFGGGRGRRRRGDVRLAILRLLGEAPRNGYGLMQTIEERSGGRWRPSPGSIYPTLAQLQDEELIRAVEHEGSKRYELTEAGRAQIASTGEAPWESRDAEMASGSPDLRSLAHGLRLAVVQVARAGDASQLERAAELLAQTRRELYRILAEGGDA
ncbi:MAG: PadR family transcriptional regulator [Actinomycetota bacterium]|nr:PadR family transcriptional regulator [Actinomycetota bacterium]